MLGYAALCFGNLVLAWKVGTSCIDVGRCTATFVGEGGLHPSFVSISWPVSGVPFWGQVRVGCFQAVDQCGSSLRCTAGMRGGAAGYPPPVGGINGVVEEGLWYMCVADFR